MDDEIIDLLGAEVRPGDTVYVVFQSRDCKSMTIEGEFIVLGEEPGGVLKVLAGGQPWWVPKVCCIPLGMRGG